MKRTLLSVALSLVLRDLTAGAQDEAGDDAAELAKKLSNPVAALITVPFQNNFEFGGGPNDGGFRYTLNFQPVVPISLTGKTSNGPCRSM
jgi:hypothetical protein